MKQKNGNDLNFDQQYYLAAGKICKNLKQQEIQYKVFQITELNKFKHIYQYHQMHSV